MKKMKLGFTIAEVATALGIVGIIFAMVIPLINNNVEQQKSGAILGRLVEQVAVGNQNLIQFANARRNDTSYSDVLSTVTQKDLGVAISDTLILGADFAAIIPAYWGLDKNKIASSSIIDIKGYSGASNDSDAHGKIKNGSCYKFSKHTANVCVAKGTVKLSSEPFERTGYTVYFDVNGLDVRPNRVGRDIFAFDVLNDGNLVPANTGNAGKYAKGVVEDGFRNLGRSVDVED